MEPSEKTKHNTPLLIIGGAVIAALFLAYGQNSGQPPRSNLLSEPPAENTANAGYETITDSQGIVAVTVTPIELSAVSSVWKFKVLFDVHSGSLDQDMLTTAVLVDDGNRIYRPTKWDGSPPGGHHREGVLSFMTSTAVPKQVQLKILNIDVPERNFTWTLK